ncbi:uncharacterized protein LOC120680629 [Panicum virgatum]|uniref:PHD-type zinc finger plants domain-containing protein n=1 Tax=Panicum virgatum TaxID=38727 RepID=A0A8T0PX80_PANVG|nr:uncharacterized protein LOC120680629 [Panicum virgatum]KAG2566563.1 hypothetical protein PVAP13_7NG184900 [Panicum virgatum]
MAPPPPPSAGAVCCMCGDQGLPGELFRCRRCRGRLQHRYCSDLYPRAAAYRRCNWCLREPLPDHGGRPSHAAAAVANNSSPKEKRKTAPAASGEERQQRHEGCSSRRPPAEPGRPVKKKHKAEERTPPPPPKPKEIIITDASGSSKEVMRAGKTRVHRVRVQRYKLLAEVISC